MDAGEKGFPFIFVATDDHTTILEHGCRRYIHETATLRLSHSLQISINWSKSFITVSMTSNYVYHIGRECENMVPNRLIIGVVSPWSYRLPEIFCHRQ